MTVEELKDACRAAIATKEKYGFTSAPHIQLVSPSRRTPLPRKGWPRPQLLCDTDRGTVWLYRADRVLAVLEAL
jgi:hypothetical protein